MDRKMPSSIDYSDVLPLSVPAQSRRRKFFPVNGGEFRDNGNNEIHDGQVCQYERNIFREASQE